MWVGRGEAVLISSTHKGYVYPLPVKIDYFDVNVLTCFFTHYLLLFIGPRGIQYVYTITIYVELRQRVI